jgi:DNA-binding transcriptional regulator YdaS (Cro superfamily)
MSHQLRTWLSKTSSDQRQLVAESAETSVAYLWQLSGGHRKASLEMAKRLQDATDGELTIEGLRPDIFGDPATQVA